MGGMLICRSTHALWTKATGLDDLCLKLKLGGSAAAVFVGVLVREVGVPHGDGERLCGVGARSRSKSIAVGDGVLVLSWLLPRAPLLLNGLSTAEEEGVEGGVARGVEEGVALGRVGGVEGAGLKRLGRLMMFGRNRGEF